MSYAVFDNGRPAKYPECNVDNSWDNNEFVSFEDAFCYVEQWLEPYGEGIVIGVNQPVDYSGYGDMIEIREV